jgi:hypothetical protein
MRADFGLQNETRIYAGAGEKKPLSLSVMLLIK